mmetsp:Transcript_45188/g.104464  ORF Transcript_45188/g.104464 Transcript_45188/m.104464 type:complete len:284 (-) Transcript_45188:3-854(-)
MPTMTALRGGLAPACHCPLRGVPGHSRSVGLRWPPALLGSCAWPRRASAASRGSWAQRRPAVPSATPAPLRARAGRAKQGPATGANHCRSPSAAPTQSQGQLHPPPKHPSHHPQRHHRRPPPAAGDPQQSPSPPSRAASCEQQHDPPSARVQVLHAGCLVHATALVVAVVRETAQLRSGQRTRPPRRSYLRSHAVPQASPQSTLRLCSRPRGHLMGRNHVDNPDSPSSCLVGTQTAAVLRRSLQRASKPCPHTGTTRQGSTSGRGTVKAACGRASRQVAAYAP